MSVTTAPPMAAPPTDPAAGAAPPSPEDAAQEGIMVMASVADEVINAAIKDPTIVRQIFKTAMEIPELAAMLQGGAREAAEPLEEEDSFEDDLEALVSGSDDVGEISEDDLLMMSM